MSLLMPSLTVSESGELVSLHLGSFARGEGRTLQEAGDDLIRRLLALVMAIRSSGFTASREVPLDLDTLNFLAELGELAAAGGDIRSCIFDA
jgi:hypothetical protein